MIAGTNSYDFNSPVANCSARTVRGSVRIGTLVGMCVICSASGVGYAHVSNILS